MAKSELFRLLDALGEAIGAHVGADGDSRLRVIADYATRPAGAVEGAPATKTRLVALGRHTPDDLAEIKGQIEAADPDLESYEVTAMVRAGSGGEGPCADRLLEVIADAGDPVIAFTCEEVPDGKGNKVWKCTIVKDKAVE